MPADSATGEGKGGKPKHEGRIDSTTGIQEESGEPMEQLAPEGYSEHGKQGPDSVVKLIEDGRRAEGEFE